MALTEMKFDTIRQWRSGQDEAFEELVSLLAKRDDIPAGAQFRRIDGRGGDGGAEAIWRFKDGSERAYQAKFFLSSAAIGWAQLDDSVSTVLRIHPSITRYVI